MKKFRKKFKVPLSLNIAVYSKFILLSNGPSHYKVICTVCVFLFNPVLVYKSWH